MIYFIDNFLRNNILRSLNKHLVDFKEVDTGEKKFWIMDSPQDFTSYMSNKISNIEGKPVNNILSFFRISNNDVDTDWRIHCDSIIANEIPERALVLYLSDPGYDKLNGTAFWEHKKYGTKMPYDKLTTKEFDNLILNESNNLDTWKLNTVIGYKQNRLLSYPSNYFHSKYPNVSWEKGRKIFVMFYK